MKKPRANTDVELPLYSVYEEVRRIDEETGHRTVDLQSYLTLIDSLHKGYVLLSKEALRDFCAALWIKPYHRKTLTREKIGQLLEQALVAVDLDNPPPPPVANTPSSASPRDQRSSPKTRPNDFSDNTPLPPPTEAEKALTAQQGTISVYVEDAPDEAGLPGAAAGNIAQGESGATFLIKGTYLPTNPRRIEQSIRSYRQKVKGTGQWDIDWQGTVEDMSKHGHFDRLRLIERDIYSSHFTVLIDSSPSMAAFNAYSEEIAKAVKGQSNEQKHIYYFSNFPGRQLYINRSQTGAVAFEDFAVGNRKSILVISDAGAARGGYREERIMGTVRALRKLQRHRVAWMNPMPRGRWKNTSASMIAEYVNMFDIGEGSIDGLSNIVRLFKSKIQTKK